MHELVSIIIILLSTIYLIKRLGIFKKKINVNTFFLFTNLTIFLNLIYYVTDFLIPSNQLLYIIKSYSLFYMLIVMLVYNLILVPEAKKNNTKHDYYSIYDLIAHIILPSITFIDFYFFTMHETISITTLFLSLLYPLIYVIIVFIKGIRKLGKPFNHSNTYYPYFFLDITSYGTKKIIKNIIILLCLFIVLGIFYINLNNFILC